MSEIMTKKQLESSEIQTGACRFCGQIYQFETDGNASEKNWISGRRKNVTAMRRRFIKK